MEIGTWNGRHAAQMLECALSIADGAVVEYHGFDLFEDFDTSCVTSEELKKIPPSLEDVRQSLETFTERGAKVYLYKGDSEEVIPKLLDKLPKFDLIFIDGGHFYKTVMSDWSCAQQLMHEQTVVIFDDYMNPEAIQHLGMEVNAAIDSIDRNVYDVKLLAPVDTYRRDWGVLKSRLAMVTHKTR